MFEKWLQLGSQQPHRDAASVANGVYRLLLLAPEVQEEILFLERPLGAPPVSERGLREALLATND